MYVKQFYFHFRIMNQSELKILILINAQIYKGILFAKLSM